MLLINARTHPRDTAAEKYNKTSLGKVKVIEDPPTHTHTVYCVEHEKCYETFCAVKLVRACIYSPSSVIVARGRVNRAQPSALAFTLCQSLSCPSSPSVSNTRLFLSESLWFWNSVLLFPTPSLLSPLSHSLWVCLCASHWKTFSDKYSFAPTTAPTPRSLLCLFEC